MVVSKPLGLKYGLSAIKPINNRFLVFVIS